MKRKNLTDLNRRLAVSVVAIALIAFLMVFSHLVVIKALLVIFVAALASVGIWEYVQLVRAKSLQPALTPMIIVAVCEVVAFFLAHKMMVFSQLPEIVLALGAAFFFLVHFKETTDAILHVAVEFFGICYVAVPLSFMLAILYPISSTGISWDGRVWLVYLILVTKVTDVGAYFVGRLWGKTPLAPILSPKKTVEGAVAGLICAVGCSVLFSRAGAAFFSSFFHLPLLGAIFLGLCIGIVGQIGDLAESLLKRDAAIKDSNTLPGLGGVLDMVDSLLLTTPVVYFYLQFHR
jgi:phosphatidate cytidylyltransferase